MAIGIITIVYDTYNYSIHGVYKLYKPIYNIWGAHIVPGLSSGDFLMAQSNPNDNLIDNPKFVG